MNIQQAIKAVINKQDLSEDEMHAVMSDIMTGKTTDAQIGGFLVGLSMKGETVEEITAAAKVMRSLATGVQIHHPKHLVDTCGTGGDGLGLFNISTACTFVVAAAGGQVAKHGNRSISSKSGSADVLEAAGVNLDMSPEKIGKCVEKIGVGFMFAPAHHSAMKHAIGPRKELAVRTIFNVLGPLTNPAKAPNQIMGVYDKSLVEPIAKVLKGLGSKHVMVVHSKDGLDEISIADDTFVAELKDDKVTTYTINPTELGLPLGNLNDIKADDADDSLILIQQALDGKEGSAKNIIALNSGAAIYVSGLEDSLQAGVNRAVKILNNGSAHQKLDDFVKESTGC
ncbi:MAG: anthranilate phosphoribosyltransferase [Candidatus Thioglobus sp.]|jgi:anthranilate phosphoribosyltransferase|uniref:anthranilate phosphoribosyltransferase n=1 Tax=Candidatus Thioglobus sp. TaxID=2026721 RepID=UPI0001BD357F|nr:anthranilate phosphoribosyltransferase [Candidatus Thioglobus sp.]EEZ80678.1 MAG: anthranilate phosphoribosyltransferase [uncultured Candidatus Thioglobus sp.]MBT3186135.1 anthranilate phosphoribosyltransferase [Candidatus Thioglobus sp.]MBT3431138.1 anthranilate phosphoribosyltransferase [Candidatus Thioglobus sp.]MBT4553366.1 anthranilate phosphoribosyltransferase [Candidatus Thioglobus sp.]MBT6656107.1 anthranilate phosphoribosyltransferase [Candidatus Thioglobus sp.]